MENLKFQKIILNAVFKDDIYFWPLKQNLYLLAVIELFFCKNNVSLKVPLIDILKEYLDYRKRACSLVCRVFTFHAEFHMGVSWKVEKLLIEQ